ncbi:MAG: urease accessory protein UreD [Sporolactobacillus sp.]|jgi:urease accessory protein|nr:urease accessory protein UreD [Sporolactobacillus sp.]
MGYKCGILNLLFEKKGNRTIASNIFYHGALKVIRPQYSENGQIGYILVNPGGGYLQGDLYRIDLKLKNCADVHLTTQAATKIYRTDQDAARQYLAIQLRDQSRLEFLPGPIIPYAGSDFVQNQTVEMDKGCSLFLSSIMTGGYDVQHRKFTFKQIDLKTKIFFEQRLKVFDRLHFMRDDPLEKSGYMAGFSHLGSVVAIYPKFSENDILALRRWLPNDQEIISGITTLSVPGFIIRFLSYRTQIIERQIQRVLKFFRKKCNNDERVVKNEF